MALRHVRCIGINEEEMVAATAILKKYAPFERSGYYVTGFVDEAEIAELERRGLMVEVLPDSARIGWLEPGDASPRPELLSNLGLAVDSSLRALAHHASERYIIQFNGPLGEAERKQLADLCIRLCGYVPDFAYKVALTKEQRQAVELLGFVKRIVHYTAHLTLRRLRESTIARAPRVIRDPALPAEAVVPAPTPPRAQDEEAIYDIQCHDAADLRSLHDALHQDARIDRLEAGRNRLRVWTTTGSRAESLKADIAQLPQVSVIERFEYPTPQCEFVRQALGVELPSHGTPLPWDGSGQIVGVADSGVDTQHPDLKSQIQTLVERVVPEAPDDPFGHGTHVSSIVCSDGTASGGKIKGIAPGAKLFVQSIRDAHGRYSGLPVDLATLFQEAYDADVRVHNNSWGIPISGLYTIDAYEVDQFVYEHPDFLIVLAAGNHGQQPNPADPDDPLSRIAFSSLASPAAAKNALTVGACCSSRIDGPYQGQSWSRYNGQLPSPQRPPVSEEIINGDLTVMAAFSGRGPSDDERVKPDLVAPGTVVLAARSAPSTPAFPEPAFGGFYAYQSGTSMAAPAVAGAAAIARQYYISERHHAHPSAALIKATLINGCVWIDRNTANDERVGRPNFHQGFGRLELSQSFPLPNNTQGFRLNFVDIANDVPEALTSTQLQKSAWRKRVHVKSGTPFRVTLAWTDYPAHGLQNHLDLILLAPNNQRIVGNPDLNRGPWAKTDRFNNVERLVADPPTEGIWTVAVMASNTPASSQGFSLVATGCLLTDFF